MGDESLEPKLRFAGFDDDWEIKKLDDLSKIQRGASPRPISSKKWYDFENKNVGWVRIGDVTSSSKYLTETEDYFSEEGIKKSRFLPKGSLIMSICATIGKPIITDIDTCIHDGFVGFSELNINKEFLYYYLNILEPKFYSLSQTGSQANLNSDLVRISKIGVPSEKEQEKIVKFLSMMDNKIKLLEKKYDSYLNFKKYLMQQIFAQKLRFADNENWKTVKLGDVCKITMGQSPSSENYSENNFHTVLIQGNADIINGKVVPRVYTSEITKISKPGDIIMTVRAPVGDLAINEFESCIGRGVCSIEGNKFIYYLLQSLKDNHVWERLSQGSTFESINSNDIKNLKVKMPSEETQNTISLFLTEIDSKIELYEIQFLTFQKLKKGLLQQMFVCLWKLIKKLMKLKSDFITE